MDPALQLKLGLASGLVLRMARSAARLLVPKVSSLPLLRVGVLALMAWDFCERPELRLLPPKLQPLPPRPPASEYLVFALGRRQFAEPLK